jgi:hypothetical protein
MLNLQIAMAEATKTAMTMTGETNSVSQSSPDSTIATTAAVASSTTTAGPPNKKQRVVVINPYVKRRAVPADVDPVAERRRRFINESRALALEHVHRHYLRMRATSTTTTKTSIATAIEPVTAHEVRCATRRWRDRPSHGSGGNKIHHDDDKEDESRRHPLSSSSSSSCRPRLFLLQRQRFNIRVRRRGEEGGGVRGEEEGVWELDKGITEISGEGGSGKTQICLGLCVTCVMMRCFPLPRPPLPGGPCGYDGIRSTTATDVDVERWVDVSDDHFYHTAIYVSMGEGIRSVTIARRLEQIVNARLNSDEGDTSGGGINGAAKRILSRIVLITIRNEDEFEDFVVGTLPNLLDRMDPNDRQRHDGRHLRRRRRTKVGLIAFDGIAGIFRFSDNLSPQCPTHDSNSAFYMRRSSRLLRISSRLRELSDWHDIPILITNQVTAFASGVGVGSRSSRTSSTHDGGQHRWAVPALGLAWSNCVTTRYILRRTNRMVDAAAVEIRGNPEGPGDAGRKIDIVVSRNMMRVREARILQLVNMPADREVQFVVDTGDVMVVASAV